MSLRCWLWGHLTSVYRYTQDGRLRQACPRCDHEQAFADLPEIVQNNLKAAERVRQATDAKIVAQRERHVEARRQRDTLHLVGRKPA